MVLNAFECIPMPMDWNHWKTPHIDTTKWQKPHNKVTKCSKKHRVNWVLTEIFSKTLLRERKIKSMNDVTQDSTIMKQITVAAECIATVVMHVPILNVHKRSSFLENQWFPFTMPRRMLLSVFHVHKYTLQLNLSCFLYFEMLLRLLGGWKQN